MSIIKNSDCNNRRSIKMFPYRIDIFLFSVIIFCWVISGTGCSTETSILPDINFQKPERTALNYSEKKGGDEDRGKIVNGSDNKTETPFAAATDSKIKNTNNSEGWSIKKKNTVPPPEVMTENSSDKTTTSVDKTSNTDIEPIVNPDEWKNIDLPTETDNNTKQKSINAAESDLSVEDSMLDLKALIGTIDFNKSEYHPEGSSYANQQITSNTPNSKIVIESNTQLGDALSEVAPEVVTVFKPDKLRHIYFPQRVVCQDFYSLLTVVEEMFGLFTEMKPNKMLIISETGLRVYDVSMIADKLSPQIVESLLVSPNGQAVMQKETGKIFVYDNASGHHAVSKYLDNLAKRYRSIYEYSTKIVKEDKIVSEKSGQVRPSTDNPDIKIMPLSDTLLSVKVFPNYAKLNPFEAVVPVSGGIITNDKKKYHIKVMLKQISL